MKLFQAREIINQKYPDDQVERSKKLNTKTWLFLTKFEDGAIPNYRCFYLRNSAIIHEHNGDHSTIFSLFSSRKLSKKLKP